MTIWLASSAPGTGSGTAPDVATVIVGVLGGLALFLFGMRMLADALQAVAGHRLKKLLRRITRNRFVSAGSGALVTSVIQSSSVTTVFVIGFVSASLMTLQQAIAVIIGANIGTTVTAHIIAFRIADQALVLVAIGFFVRFLSHSERTRQAATLVLGLGFVFFGMAVMGQAVAPLCEYEPALRWLAAADDPAVSIIIGAVFTAIVQSSSATTGIIVTFAAQGLIGLPAGIALALGANVGTCVKALLASIGQPRVAVRAAWAHVLFNVVGVVVWLPLIPVLANVASGVVGGTGPDALPRQIATAHTIFNVANAAVAIWFIGPMAALLTRLLPDRPIHLDRLGAPHFIRPQLLANPELALDAARSEIARTGEIALTMLDETTPRRLLTGSAIQLRHTRHRDELIDSLHGHIVRYLGEISRAELASHQTADLLTLLEANNSFEHVGDAIESQLVGVGLRRLDEGVAVSEPTREMLTGFHAAVRDALVNAVGAVAGADVEAARRVRQLKPTILRLEARARIWEAGRLAADEPKRMQAYRLESDCIIALKQIFDFANRIAKSMLPPPDQPAGDQTANAVNQPPPTGADHS